MIYKTRCSVCHTRGRFALSRFIPSLSRSYPNQWSHPSQNYLWDSQGEPVEQPASRAAEASFVASFYLALGCFSCIFNFPSVIRGLLGIRGRLRLIEISITC